MPILPERLCEILGISMRTGENGFELLKVSGEKVRQEALIIALLCTGGILLAGCSTERVGLDETSFTDHNQESRMRYTVVQPGEHPSLLFSAAELGDLRAKAQSDGLAREMWEKIKALSDDWTMPGEWTKEGMEINAKALVYLVEDDQDAGRDALEKFKQILDAIEPYEYYLNEVDSDFFLTEHWPKAFAFAYDWLYDLMTEADRKSIVDKLELWCDALYRHTESWWWRNAEINCGAIPVGALGLLSNVIRAESDHPDLELWLSSATERLRDNYYTFSWRTNGICTEGPCYAHYHKNATMFGESLRRAGGEDIITNRGVLSAMAYQRFQWQPQGGCGPIGDNTDYGRRVLQSIYLFGIGETNDRAGLWTFERFTDRTRLNPIYAFIFYPTDVEPVSPGTLNLPTSKYFEITPNQAGYIISRSEWDSERAHYFSFVTRYGDVNHQHYDMNTFLFNAFDTKFATHENLFSYGNDLHGADIEHNIVIVGEGGMPVNDRPSAGDDCSLYGYLTGLGLGHFADYVRGDGRLSYADRSVTSSTPAVRADRTGIFVKQGPNPYVIMVDDFQKSEAVDHDYHWQWYSEVKELSGGTGTLSDPFVLSGDESSCAVAFLILSKPDFTFEVARGGNKRHPKELGLIRVGLRGKRVRYFSIGAAWERGSKAPVFRKGPVVKGNPEAMSLVVEGGDYSDLIIWQPEETAGQPGETLTCGSVVSDGFLTVVRRTAVGTVTGYVLGDGTYLEVNGNLLAEGRHIWSVSADSKRLFATGGRLARENQEPYPASGKAWAPSRGTEIFVDDREVAIVPNLKGMVTIGG